MLQAALWVHQPMCPGDKTDRGPESWHGGRGHGSEGCLLGQGPHRKATGSDTRWWLPSRKMVYVVCVGGGEAESTPAGSWSP